MQRARGQTPRLSGLKIIEKTYSIESTHVGISDSQYHFKIEKNLYNKPVLCDDGELIESDEN